MTDRRGPDRVTVALLSGAAFLLVLAFLVTQLADRTPAHPRQVLVRKIYETRVVREAGAGAAATAGAAAGATVTQSSSSSPSPPPPTTASSR